MDFRCSGFDIPRTINSSVFRFDDTQLLFLNGLSEEPSDRAMHYYLFDMEKGRR